MGVLYYSSIAVDGSATVWSVFDVAVRDDGLSVLEEDAVVAWLLIIDARGWMMILPYPVVS